jgi:alkane 1-monooxygenase
MMKAREYSRASGYLFIFAPPLLLAASTYLLPVLAFLGLILVLPLLRLVFGDAPDHQPEWSEGAAQILETLPIAAACSHIAALLYSVWVLRHDSWSEVGLFQLGLSLWATFTFATCISHELLHRRDAASKLLGRVLSGIIGYPFQEHEHRTHHSAGEKVDRAEFPAATDSVWQFTARRFRHILRTTWEGDVQAATRRGHRLAGGMPLSLASTAVTSWGFGLAAGIQGFVLYAAVTVAVVWTMQAMTYVQHWGLVMADELENRAINSAWEDRCQVQAWITLNIGFHQAHHQQVAVPYYRQSPAMDAPLQPGGYVVLLFASMAPPLWRVLMMPVLVRWRQAPHSQSSPGRQLLCWKR